MNLSMYLAPPILPTLTNFPQTPPIFLENLLTLRSNIKSGLIDEMLGNGLL